MIDVRAPAEFARGAFPNATNLPILDDQEREQVGICYAQSGQAAATELGQELVSGNIRKSRLEAWKGYLDAHPDALLYCFRGGLRSGIACEWLQAEGLKVPRIDGGYKRLRNLLLSRFEQLPDLVVVSGRTGCGKTEFLGRFQSAIDLEGIANHRGSAFGGRLSPQPCQVDFENTLAIAMLRLDSNQTTLIEDEGRLIGRIHLPLRLQDAMRQAPIVLLDDPLEHRARRIYGEYIERQWQEYSDYCGEAAHSRFENYLLTAVDAIRKRLGNTGHADIRRLIVDACRMHRDTGDPEGHLTWIKHLLKDYYDPMYNYQLAKKTDRIRITGDHQAIADWLVANSIH